MSHLRGWKERNASSFITMDIFRQMSQPKNLTIRELEELQAIEKEASEEEFDKKDHTLVTSDFGRLL